MKDYLKHEAFKAFKKIFDERNDNIDEILNRIRQKLGNQHLYELLSTYISNELHNYNFQYWGNDKRKSVADSIVDTLKVYTAEVQERGWLEAVNHGIISDEQRIKMVFEISEAIKKRITDDSKNTMLQAAIKNRNVDDVCISIAEGANASKFIFLVIKDPTKNHLLPFLLRAGVDPNETYVWNGLGYKKTGLVIVLPPVSKVVYTAVKVKEKMQKVNFNLLSYAIRYQNEAALKIILDHKRFSIFYPQQLSAALNYQVSDDNKLFEGCTPLTIALMTNKKKVNPEMVIMAWRLIEAGAKLTPIKKGSSHINYNNLQLMVKFELEKLLLEIIKIHDKSKLYKEDLLNAMLYKSTTDNSSQRTAIDSARWFVTKKSSQLTRPTVQKLRDTFDLLQNEFKPSDEKPESDTKNSEAGDKTNDYENTTNTQGEKIHSDSEHDSNSEESFTQGNSNNTSEPSAQTGPGFFGRAGDYVRNAYEYAFGDGNNESENIHQSPT